VLISQASKPLCISLNVVLNEELVVTKKL
jgi:hypothetical protein